MGSLTFTIPRFERPIPEILSRIPRPFREQAEKGFVVLADVGQHNYAEILQAVIFTLESKKPPLAELEKSLKLPMNDLGSLFAASMLMVPILADGANADDFVSSAVKGGLIGENLVPKIRPFVDTVMAQRVQIERAIRRATLPAQVLPHISDVEIVVDLRVAFEEQAVIEAVPVAIVHIDTDVDGKEIWFQSSKQQMQQLKSDIDEAIKKMEVADAWGRREPKE
jgi:hypothetical protein